MIGWNSLTDLFLFIVPAWIIWTLTLQMKKKVVLLLLLGLSLLAFVATLIKTYWLRVLGSINDPTCKYERHEPLQSQLTHFKGCFATLSLGLCWRHIRSLLAHPYQSSSNSSARHRPANLQRT